MIAAQQVKLMRHFDHENVIQIVDLLPPLTPDFEDIYIVMAQMDSDLDAVVKFAAALLCTSSV